MPPTAIQIRKCCADLYHDKLLGGVKYIYIALRISLLCALGNTQQFCRIRPLSRCITSGVDRNDWLSLSYQTVPLHEGKAGQQAQMAFLLCWYFYCDNSSSGSAGKRLRCKCGVRFRESFQATGQNKRMLQRGKYRVRRTLQSELKRSIFGRLAVFRFYDDIDKLNGILTKLLNRKIVKDIEMIL